MTDSLPGDKLRTVREAIAARRSIRKFAPKEVPPQLVGEVLLAAFDAPAPHHTTPWRFAVLIRTEAKRSLAEAMAKRWVEDMLGDGIDADRAEHLASQSISRLTSAPVLVLACLVTEGLHRYPDERRRRAEWAMALLSLGAALENVMVCASAAGLGTCWIAAPIFAPEEARASLSLPEEWVPQALLMMGVPDRSYVPRERPSPDLAEWIRYF
mgnify:CR=1 FL=1